MRRGLYSGFSRPGVRLVEFSARPRDVGIARGGGTLGCECPVRRVTRALLLRFSQAARAQEMQCRKMADPVSNASAPATEDRRVDRSEISALGNPDGSHVEAQVIALGPRACGGGGQVLVQKRAGTAERSDVSDAAVGATSARSVPLPRDVSARSLSRLRWNCLDSSRICSSDGWQQASSGDWSQPAGASSASTSGPAKPNGNSRSSRA